MKTRKLFPIKLYFILILLLGCNGLLHAGDSIPDATLDSLAEIIHSFPEDVEDDTTARNRLRLLRMTQLLEGFSQIEELTLYIIKQEETIEQLNQQVENLSK